MDLALRFREQLDETTGNELEQLVASINQSLRIGASQNASYRCAATHRIAQSVPDATFTEVLFSSNELDGSNMHPAGGTRFTIRKGGMYAVRCGGLFAASAVGQRILRATRNGVLIEGGGTAAATVGAVYSHPVAYMVDVALDVGDVVKFEVYQNSGGPLNFGFTYSVGLAYLMTRASLVRYAD